MGTVRTLEPTYYEALKRLTLELAGVQLGEDAEFLVETRLSALARQEGYVDLMAMVEDLFSVGQTRLAVHVVSALLERDMRFFEDKGGYNSLAHHIWPMLTRRFPNETLNVLVIGCGSGQETYSIAMSLNEITQAAGGQNQFLVKGVDYPSRALTRATQGRFTHFEVQRGLPIKNLVRYFTRDKEDWVVKDALRAYMQFQDIHLLSDLPKLDKYHLVVMRNSLDRYAPTASVQIKRCISDLLHIDGYLMMGCAETLDGYYGVNAISTCPGFYIREDPVIETEPEPERPTVVGQKLFG